MFKVMINNTQVFFIFYTNFYNVQNMCVKGGKKHVFLYFEFALSYESCSLAS